MISRRVFGLTTGLTTKQRFFDLIDARLGALFRNVIVNVQDHFFIGMAHPNHGLMHVNPGIPEHGAIGVPEIVRANVHGMARRFGQVQDVRFPTAGE